MRQFGDLNFGFPDQVGLVDLVYLLAAMVFAGALGYVIRALYRRFGSSISNRDAFSANFPLISIATVLIIFVIKSSLALSLGLIGALSIVRFRAAIKEPEEIVYLFFCIAIGIALGARYWAFAVAGTAVFALFVAGGHMFGNRDGTEQLLLTITGRQDEIPGGDVAQFTKIVSEAVGHGTVQRFGVIDGEVQYRVAIPPRPAEKVGEMLAALRARLPAFRISYINVQGLL